MGDELKLTVRTSPSGGVGGLGRTVDMNNYLEGWVLIGKKDADTNRCLSSRKAVSVSGVHLKGVV